MYLFLHKLSRHLLLLAVCLSLQISAPLAAPVHDFNRALAEVMHHYRWVDQYLRTGNIALAQLELDEFTAKAASLAERFSSKPPDLFADDPDWRRDMEELSGIAGAALRASDAGEFAKVKELLAPVRAKVRDLRRRNGLFLFADCIDAANASFARLWRFRHNPPDFAKPEQVDAMRQDLSVTLYWYRRCNREAPEAARRDEQFRRLMDGNLRSLERIFEAAREQDADRIVRLLREIRSSDRMLYLKFG
jgi:hypothetical protein